MAPLKPVYSPNSLKMRRQALWDAPGARHLGTSEALWALLRTTSYSATFAEPNELATNSRSFWLAARCPGLAGNGQYCGETVALWYGNIAHRSKPDAPLSHSCIRKATSAP